MKLLSSSHWPCINTVQQIALRRNSNPVRFNYMKKKSSSLSKCLIRFQGEAKILKPILSPRYGRNQVHLLHGLVSSLIKANTCVQNIYICWFTFQSSSKCTIITPDVLDHQPLHFPFKLLRLDTFFYFLQDMILKKVKLQWEFIANSSPISITAEDVVQQGQRMVWAAI